jgi:sulfur carrier protein ThiS
MNSAIDMRGFEYALEAVQLRRRWQLESSRLVLVRANSAHAEVGQKLSRLQSLSDEQNLLAAQTIMRSMDPGLHRRLLIYLAELNQQVDACRRELEHCQQRVNDAQHRCIEQQQLVDLLDKHRAEQELAYADAARSRIAVETDQDWIARTSWGVKQLSHGIEYVDERIES